MCAKKKKFGLEIFLGIILVAFIVMIFAHEGTHIALNGFRVDGFCILNCNPMLEGGALGNHYTPFGVYLSQPIFPLAENEVIATFVGYLGFVGFLVLCAFKLELLK